MKRLLLAIVALAQTASAEPPRRIVSLNLCADQLVLALADRGQIAALTQNAADPGMSAEWRKAKGLRRLRSPAEEVLAIRPDLVVAMDYQRGLTDAPFVGLGPSNSYTEIPAAIRQVAKAVGHPARGEALIARMTADLAKLPPAGSGKVAAYYQRRGYLTGAGTLVDDLIRRAGLTNLATALGKPPLSQLSLEELVAARPDYLIVEAETDRVTDQGTEMLHHPILAGIPRLRLPQAWTVCAGPAYAWAARSLAAQIRQSPHRAPPARR